MGESHVSEKDIDELAAAIERRIKRNEKLLALEKYAFEEGRQMRLTGIQI